MQTKLIKNRNKEERAMPGRKFKGGIQRYEQVKRDVLKLLNDGTVTAVTTMIDYYGLPADFPGFETQPNGSCYERVVYLEQLFEEDIARPRFRSFLTLHEFEALLFTDVNQIASVFPGESVTQPLTEIVNQFDSPEEINAGPTTHPSARLQTCTKRYRKTLHGALIAQGIGLTAIRQQCSHFNEWICWLENLKAD